MSRLLQYRTREDSGEFRVPLHQLGDIRLGDIPPHSTVELIDIPQSPAGYHLGIRSTNCEDAGNYRSLGISNTVSIAGTTNIDRRLSRIRRAFEQEVQCGAVQNPQELRFDLRGEHVSCIGYSQPYADRPETVFAEAIAPVLRAFDRLMRPDIRLFVCHASEDKPVASAFAAFLHERGTHVWFDQWEIRVGDSIVQKVSDALAEATHLAILLSSTSITKPWVQREMSSALMRQLADRSISVLPLLLDDCVIPAILADIRYADCRRDRESGFTEALHALS